MRAEPGWYADPWRQAPWRWWDGVAWAPYTWPPAPGMGLPWQPPVARPPWAVAVAVADADADAGNGASYHGGRGLRRAFRPTVLWILVAMLAGIVAGIVPMVGLVAVGADDNTAFAVLTMIVYPVMFAGFALTARRISRQYGTGDLRQDFGWRRFRRSDLWLGLLAGVGAMIVQIVIGLVLPQPDDGSYESAVFGDDPNLLVILAMALPVVVGAPIFEELVFRGPVQRSLVERFGRWPGLVGQGAVFSLYHVVGSFSLVEAWYLVPLFAVGVVFGYVVERTGRLAPAQIAHAVMNVIAYAALASTV